MKIYKLVLIFIFVYSAVLTRYFINNIFVVSSLGSFIYGYTFSKEFNAFLKYLIFIAFCSSLTTFSGFIPFLYKLIINGAYLQSFLIINLTIGFNLISMYSGFLIGKKII